jgi:hypothetical protein
MPSPRHNGSRQHVLPGCRFTRACASRHEARCPEDERVHTQLRPEDEHDVERIERSPNECEETLVSAHLTEYHQDLCKDWLKSALVYSFCADWD